MMLYVGREQGVEGYSGVRRQLRASQKIVMYVDRTSKFDRVINNLIRVRPGVE